MTSTGSRFTRVIFLNFPRGYTFRVLKNNERIVMPINACEDSELNVTETDSVEYNSEMIRLGRKFFSRFIIGLSPHTFIE